MEKDTLTNLTRRKVLASLGTVGVGAALGGAGTAAFFSDQETFANNELVAGSLDLKVDWEEHYNGEIVESYPDRDADPGQDGPYSLATIKNNPELVGLDGTATADELRQAYRDQFADVPGALAERRPVISLRDVKPGDEGEVTFSCHLFDQSGYVWLTTDLLRDADNSQSELEADDPDEVDGMASGELLEAIRAVVWYDDGDNVREDEETITVGKSTDGSGDIVYSKEEAVMAEGSLGDVLDELAGRVPMDSDLTTPERDCLPNSTTRYVALKWWLPADHANEVQTDSVAFDLGFYAEQCAHNDGSGIPPEAAAVTFDAQESDGTSVTVSMAYLPDGGYVAIHDPTQSDQIVGYSAYLAEGKHRDVTVDLNAGIDSDRELLAMVHTDDGDRSFAFPGDDPYTDDGSPVTDTATVTVTGG